MFLLDRLATEAPKRRITLSAARLEQLQTDWRVLHGEAPTPQEEELMITAEVEEEVLLLFALERGLEQRDPATRRRLINLMRFVEPESESPEDSLLQGALDLDFHRRDAIARDHLLRAARLALAEPFVPPNPSAEELEAFARRFSPGAGEDGPASAEERRRWTAAWRAAKRQEAVAHQIATLRESYEVHREVSETPLPRAKEALP